MSTLGEDVERTVPDFTGLGYEAAVELQRSLGLHFADPDPDAPPVSNYWWQHQDLVVLTQKPPAGVRIARRTSITVTLGSPHATLGARAEPIAPPSFDTRA